MATGMIIDGVFASQAIDSSGEVLDVEGCDISTLDKDGVANYEHKEGDKKGIGNNGEEIVGRIIYAKKVFGLSDCDTERERDYWNEVKVPFIYGMVRLYDGAGHSGAQALAAQIRDHYANGERILVRFSIEGSTLDRDGNHLKASVARRVALTLKPCNRTAVSGLIEDPRAPEGFEKKPVEPEKKVEDLLAGLVEKTEEQPILEHPGYMKLGGVHEYEGSPMIGEDVMAKLKLVAKARMLKALAAGSYNVAPSSLTQGAALQRESLAGRVKRSIHEYKAKKFDKAEWKAFAKTYLPEADDNFLDHFAGVAEDYHMKRMKKALDLDADREVQPQQGLGWAEPEKPKPVKAAPAPKKSKSKKAAAAAPASTATPTSAPTTGLPDPKTPIAAVGGGAKNRLHLDEKGTLTTPKGYKLSLHIPTSAEYLSILHPDLYDIPEDKRQLYKRTVHEPWERAMENWMELNKRAREGKIPRSVVKLAGLFSAMSPNTGVPLQERHYGHLMDMLHEGMMDINQPITQEHISEFERRAQGPDLPWWNRELYESTIPPESLPEDERARYPQGKPAFPPPGVESWEEAEERAAEPNKFGNEKAELPQIAGLRHLDDILPHLEHLFATHKGDARKMAEELMNMKAAYKRYTTKKGPDGKQMGAAASKEHFADKHPIVAGFGPKLTRYMLSMAGAGNIIVPDRHMTRSLFNLGKEDPMSEYLATQVVTKPGNEQFLRALDQHFYHKHPAVKYVLEKYPEHFKGHEEQAIFPAFWLHWLHIPHYERNQGRETEATIGGTDHRVFWDSVVDSLRKHGIPIRGEHYEYQPPDTSFDFGANVGDESGYAPKAAMTKAEVPHPMAHMPFEARAFGALAEIQMKHGDAAALAAYYSHVVPELLDREKRAERVRRDPNAIVRKVEALTIELRKATDEVRAFNKAQQPQGVHFAGNYVQPGKAQLADGAYDLLHEDDNNYVAAPEGTQPDEYPHKLVKLPKLKEGTHYTVLRRPSVLVYDLE